MLRSRLVLPLPLIVGLAPLHAAGLPTTKENFPWLGNQLGITHQVPQPWTPVEVNGTVVSVWGRTICYEGSLLPAQIVNQGINMLAAPMSALVVAGGEPATFGPADFALVSQRDDQVVLRTIASGGDFSLAANTTIEFDGMVRVQMVLAPRRATSLEAYRVILPLRKEVAKVYSRHLEYDFENLRTDKMSLKTCMQYVGDAPIHTTFNPEIWLGNRQVGIAFATETNVQFDIANEKEVMSVIPKRDRVELIVTVVDHEVALTGPKTIEFALFPNPLKPPNSRLRGARIAASGRLFAAFQAGVDRTLCDNYAITAGEGRALYPSLPWWEHDEAYTALRERLRRNNVRYIPYGALMYSNSFHVAARSFYERWHVEPVSQTWFDNWKRYDEGYPRDLRMEAGQSWDGYRVCPSVPSYADFFVWMYCNAIQTEDIDGIYLDHGEVSHSCRNVNHPHYQGATGKDRKFYYAIFPTRELLKRLWIATKERKPDLLISQHQSHTFKSLDSFMDLVMTGETMNVIFANSATSAAVQQNPETYVPDYDKIPEVLLDYDYLETFGFQNRLLPQVKYLIEGYWREHPAEYKFYSAKLLRHTLVRGIQLWAGNLDQSALNEAWLALDKIGRMNDEVTFHPYWSNGDLVAARLPTTQVSFYQRPAKVLLIVANTGKQDVEETVVLKGEETFMRASDAVTGAPVEMNGNAVTLTVPADLYRAVLLTR